MQIDVSSLTFPKKSHRKVITFPNESTLLSEFLGIVIGDGGINNGWQVVISLNALKDASYAEYVSQVIKKLFNLTPAIRKRPNQNTLVVVATSTSLVDFLISKGAVRGNKIAQQITAPQWI